MPEVTVVIPTRDRCHLLTSTLRSVTWQRGVDLEVVVVDDGSSDATAEHVAQLHDPRIRLLRNPHPQGVSAARNRGAGSAQGRWIAFLDDDDLWAPDKLAAQLGAARSQSRGWAVTGAVSIDDRLEILAGERPLPAERIVSDIERYNAVPVGASNVIVRRDRLAEAGDFDTDLRHMADWDLWIRLCRMGPPATAPRPLVAYRLHRRSATMDTALDPTEPLAELEAIAERYGIPASRVAVLRWIGWSCVRAGRRRAAVRAYWAAIREGDLGSVPRAIIAMTHPGVGRDVFLGPFASRHVDEAWVAEARPWLRTLRADHLMERDREETR